MSRKKERKRKDENEIKKLHLQKLHRLMDEQIKNRRNRLYHAALTRDTTMQWGRLAAAVEQANIDDHELKGREAKKMKGRSKVTFKNATKNILQGIDERDGNDELATRADWLRKTAGEHAAMGNKLINIARRMKANANQQVHPANVVKNKEYDQKSREAYEEKATNTSKKKNLNEHQKLQI